MRIVFFGSGAYGLPTLRHLAHHHQIVGVVTQPDKPAGRGVQLTPTPIAEWAAQQLPKAKLWKPAKVNAPEIVHEIRSIQAEAWVVIAFGQLLGRALLADRFAINLHASLLPRWRGAAPIHAAILAGDAETGNSVITLASTMDAGLVLGQTRRVIEPTRTTGELHELLAGDGPALVDSVLDQHAAGTLTPISQDASLVTHAPKLSKDDARIGFSQPAEACRCRINGLSPWPGVTVTFRGQALKILRAAAEQSMTGASHQPGDWIDPSSGSIACGKETVLKLLDVQPAGKKLMPWADFARGHRPTHEDRLLDRRPT
jgi:methionyl-tRNA formyltransferase